MDFNNDDKLYQNIYQNTQTLASEIKQSLIKQNRNPKIEAKLGQFDNSVLPPSSNHKSFNIVQEEESQFIGVSQSIKYIDKKHDYRPTEIDNSDIEGEHPGQLKPNLIMHRDFIMLPEEAWKYIIDWYGGGPVFPRKVIINITIPTIELYPPLITSILCGKDGQPTQTSARTLFVSIAMKLSEVFLKICESFNYISTKDTRLWFKENGNEYKLVEKQILEKSLEEFIVKDGDVFMVEVKFGDKWPRDQQFQTTQQNEKNWKIFEIGDRIDLNDNNEWKIGRIVRVFKDKLKIHIINQHWKNDVVIPKDSDLIDKYGTHTFEILFQDQKLLNQSQIPAEVVGIQNIGNTCYMNAVLQSLFHTPLLREFFLQKNYEFQLQENKNKQQKNKNSNIFQQQQEEIIQLTLTQSFGELLTETLNLGQQQSVIPITFKKVVNQEIPMFFGNQQHDSQEFLSFLLDKISEEMHRVYEEDFENKRISIQNNVQIIQNSSQKQQENSNENLSNKQQNQITNPVVIENQNNSENINETINAGNLKVIDGGTGGGFSNKGKNDDNDSSNTLINNNNQIENVQNVQKTQNQQNIPIISNIKDTQSDIILQNQQRITTNERAYNTFFQSKINQGSSQAKSIYYSPHKDLELGFNGGNQSFTKLAMQQQSKTFSQFNVNDKVMINDYQIISEPERKAQEAWENEMQMQNSAISDLIVGQQICTIQCQGCKNKSFAFENFYTLSLPLPYNTKAIFYITVIKRSSIHVIPPIVKYGIQIDKTAKLIDLASEIEKVSKLSINKMAIVEIFNNKIYKFYDVMDTNIHEIHRKTNELYAFEYLLDIKDFPILPKKQIPIKGQPKQFKQIVDIKIGMIVDAQDQYQKWYVGIVSDRDFDYDTQQNSIKVHFYEFPDRWDEWYTDLTLQKVAPFGTYTEDLNDKIYTMTVTHRKLINNDNSNKKELLAMGTPLFLSIGSWFTWQQAFIEIVTQIDRFVKNMRSNLAQSQRSIHDQNENYINSDFNEEQDDNIQQNIKFSKNKKLESAQLKMQKYDSQGFSKKMTKLEKQNVISKNSREKNFELKIQDEEQYQRFVQNDNSLSEIIQIQSQSSVNKKTQQNNVKQSDIQIVIDKNKKEALTNQKSNQQSQITNLANNQTYPKSQTPSIDSKQKNLYSKNKPNLLNKTKKMYHQDEEHILKGLRNEHEQQIRTFPFKITILDGETHACAFCLFNSKYNENSKKKKEEQDDESSQLIQCTGCNMYQSNDKVKWILGCFKKLEICIDWDDSFFYKSPLISSDNTCLKLIQSEKEAQSGFPLSDCFDLYTKKQKIDDYNCDICNSKQIALIDTKISRLPDIFLIHLKRFAYHGGYLEKIEDLITFPLNNLDISKYLSIYAKKNSQLNQYDLYAVVNHIMFQNSSGGHYTSYILKEQQQIGNNKKTDVWIQCNDSSILKIDKSDVMSRDGYILFYKRKEFTASNVINLTAAAY